MPRATFKPAPLVVPKARTPLWCFLPLPVLSLGLMLSGCAVTETYMVPMRDGILLATDVYLPASANDSWPVLLIRTPYGREENESLFDFTEDYVLVIQDVRGRYDSEGEYHPFTDDGWGDNQDGYDTVAWILNQPWCNIINSVHLSKIQ